MEPLTHALIPIAFLLAMFPTLEKKYLLLAPIVWLIDFDFFIGIHRFTFHNIFFILLIAFIIWWLWNKKAFFVALFFGASHLILDLAMPGNAFLYPLYQKTIYITTSIHLFPFSYNFGFGAMSIDEYLALLSTFGPGEYLGEISFMFIILFALLLIVRLRSKYLN